MSDKKALRGKELEKKINKVNLLYRKKNLAVIYNLPLPVVVTKDGVVPITTPTDYIGAIGPDGLGIAFDAKETKSKTSFPLNNIHDHQLNFLTLFEKVGGKSGFLIWFKTLNKKQAFFVPASFIENFQNTEKRKSIPYKSFKKEWLVDLENYLDLNLDEEES